MTNQLCTRCGLPRNRPGATSDPDGVCSVCRHHELKHGQVDWAVRAQVLADLAEDIRGQGPYDAVVPFAGGKDGTYVLFYLTRVLGLRCLAVTVDNHFLRQRAWENCHIVTTRLELDHVVFRAPFPLVQRLMRAGLDLAGTVCWHCNASIAAYPVRMAVERRIPLVVYAHSLREYYAYPGRTYDDPIDSDVMDEEWYNLVTGVSHAQMVAALPDVDPRSLSPFAFPLPGEIKEAGVRAVFMSNYIKWDELRQSEIIAKELGWRGEIQEGVPSDRTYEKFDCFLVGTHDYLRFIRDGYGRGARIGAVETRMNRMTQEEAVEMALASDGRRPASLDTVLKILDMDEEELLDDVTRHITHGRDFDAESVLRGTPLRDASSMAGMRANHGS